MIPPADTLIAYIFTSIVACLIPGPAVILVVTQTVSRGFRSGLSAIWGLQIGFFIQVLAATCGLSALVLKSAMAFSVLKFAGALYLMTLGLDLLLRKKDGDTDIPPSTGPLPSSSFTHGILVNMLNPKIAVFFISYVPQFIEANTMSPIGQIFFLGVVFCALGTLISLVYAFSAKTAADKFHHIHQHSVFRRWLPGSIFLGFGLKLALFGRQ